jgi:dihydrofolate synthase/folylpolyglutamate synthase
MGEFAPAGDLVVVFGQLSGRDPVEMLETLAAAVTERVVLCPAPSPRAVPVADLVAAADRAGLAAEPAESVEAAVARGRELVGSAGALAVTGSLTVVGSARTVLGSA